MSNGTSAPPASTAYVDLSGVNVGDIFTVKAERAGATVRGKNPDPQLQWPAA